MKTTPTSPTSRTAFSFVAAALVFAALGGSAIFMMAGDQTSREAGARDGSPTEPRSTSSPLGRAAAAPPAARPALPADRAASRVSAELAAVRDYNTAQQRAAMEEEEKFLEQGWSIVKTTPPDAALVALDPTLLPAREHELRAQLESATLPDGAVDHARLIAARATEARTRRAAVDALGRNDSARAQAALRHLFDSFGDDADKHLVVGHLRPKSVDDESTAWLVERLGKDGISDDLKKQMTFALALVSLATAGKDGDPLAPLLERVPPTWRDALTASFRSVASR